MPYLAPAAALPSGGRCGSGGRIRRFPVRGHVPGTGMPSAESTASSTWSIRAAESRPSSAGSIQDFGTVAICSHLARQDCGSPASPRRIATCQAIGRARVEHGTMMTSFARRLRTSGERMIPGRLLSSETQWTAPRFNAPAACPRGAVARRPPRPPLPERPCPERSSMPPPPRRDAASSRTRVPAPTAIRMPAVRRRGASARPCRCAMYPARGSDDRASGPDPRATTPSLACGAAYAESYVCSYDGEYSGRMAQAKSANRSSA